jgi:GNAT superfamily N-acetyltransferase
MVSADAAESSHHMSDALKLEGPGFRARPLEDSDAPALQRVLEASADYYDLVLGVPPGPAEAVAVALAGPEAGADPAGKLLYGIWTPDGEDLVGVLDAFRDYPEPGVWYVGLLLLLPNVRSTGIGRKIVEALFAAAQPLGAREFQINVVEQNVAAQRFWKSLGFSETRRWRQRYGVKESTFIRMRR